MNGTAPQLQIVVAEDEDVLRGLVQHVLKKNGYGVRTARDGEECLNLVRSRRPDAIILDAMMPGLDGFEVLHALRRDQTTIDIPVIMLSARAMERDLVNSFNFGANDYLIKPFRPEELITRLRRVLNRAAVEGQDKI